jgi:hypothetical protein
LRLRHCSFKHVKKSVNELVWCHEFGI